MPRLGRTGSGSRVGAGLLAAAAAIKSLAALDVADSGVAGGRKFGGRLDPVPECAPIGRISRGAVAQAGQVVVQANDPGGQAVIATARISLGLGLKGDTNC